MEAGTSLLHELLKGDGFLSQQPLGVDERGGGGIPDVRGTGGKDKAHEEMVGAEERLTA